MLRVAAFLIAWLIAAPAWAFLPGQPVGMLNPQVQPANAIAGTPAVDDNLAAGGYPLAGGVCAEWGHQVPCNNHYSIVRASTKYVSASDGFYASVAAGVLGLGSNNGALIEEARTNDALWSRDMTNAAWVKTTMTTALNAVGIDGTANSATTLTATGASALAVQTITLASQADNYSVFLKRVTGSGTINLCLATTACGTATPCTVTSTTTFTRCTVTATVLNPIVGIQIVTNGDAVIADFNQMEPGGFPTSPMLTTSSATNRSADAVPIIGIGLTDLSSGIGFVYAKIQQLPANNNTIIVDTGNGQSFEQITNTTTVRAVGSSTPTANLPSGTFQNTGTATVAGFDGTNLSIVVNGGTATTLAGTITSTTVRLGSFQGSSNFLNTYASRVRIGKASLSSANLQAMSAQ